MNLHNAITLGILGGIAVLELWLMRRNTVTKRALAEASMALRTEAAQLMEMRRTIATGKELADLMDRLERHGRPEDIRRLRRAAAKLLPD